jgi:acetyltransferase-like isoleucine patch superfamily enzyme
LKTLNRDNVPHQADCFARMLGGQWHTFWARLAARWWDVRLGPGCSFLGRPRFRRHPGSQIVIGPNCILNSSPSSNWIGVNRPCMISTLKAGAKIMIGEGCGFSGTVILCAERIVIGRNVRCGANTLILDTWGHWDDPRSGPDAPVEIGDNVWLGVNATLLKGTSIGCGTLVGANSVVMKSLPANVIAFGSPARVIGEIKPEK